MKYYAKCNKIDSKDQVHFMDEELNLIYTINKTSRKNERSIELFKGESKLAYKVNMYPLKWKGKYQVFDKHNRKIITINLGFHLLHNVHIGTKDYVCKANLFKIRYWLYDGRTVIGRLNVIKKDQERFFEIQIEKHGTFEHALALYTIAQAQRMNIFQKGLVI